MIKNSLRVKEESVKRYLESYKAIESTVNFSVDYEHFHSLARFVISDRIMYLIDVKWYMSKLKKKYTNVPETRYI